MEVCGGARQLGRDQLNSALGYAYRDALGGDGAGSGIQRAKQNNAVY